MAQISSQLSLSHGFCFCVLGEVLQDGWRLPGATQANPDDAAWRRYVGASRTMAPEQSNHARQSLLSSHLGATSWQHQQS